MTRGPATGTNRNSNSLDKAEDAWGMLLPSWVKVLALECDKSSQRVVSNQVGFSTALLSQVLNNRYPGNLRKVEQVVSDAFIRETVDCPVLGKIQSSNCLEHQRRKFSPSSPQALRLHKACKTCPQSLKEKCNA